MKQSLKPAHFKFKIHNLFTKQGNLLLLPHVAKLRKVELLAAWPFARRQWLRQARPIRLAADAVAEEVRAAGQIRGCARWICSNMRPWA